MSDPKPRVAALYDLIAVPPPRDPLEDPDPAPTVRRIYEDLLSRIEHGDTNVLDLDQDITLMRALVIDYINRWNDFSDALIAWHFDKKGHPPDRILDITEAAVMLEQISRVVKRMHDIRQTSSLNLATVRKMMDEMALVVARHVSDATILTAISNDWDHIDVPVA